MKKNYHANGFGPLFSAMTAVVSPLHQTITTKPLYDQVEPLAINPGLMMMAKKLISWRRRSNERRALAQLDDRLLRDIGIDRSEAMAEQTKHFWQR